MGKLRGLLVHPLKAHGIKAERQLCMPPRLVMSATLVSSDAEYYPFAADVGGNTNISIKSPIAG